MKDELNLRFNSFFLHSIVHPFINEKANEKADETQVVDIPQNQIDEVELAQFIQYLCQPQKSFYQQVLSLRLPYVDEVDEDDEPFSLDHLTRYGYLDEFLQSKLTESRKKNSFIYLGRLLPQKGIEEMLRFFEKNKHYTLSIIGQGKLSSKVSQASQKNSNITYKPFIANIGKVINEIGTHEFMLLNSKKTKKWEELFGLVVIEAMSQGTIPVAADHSGPKEIINNSF